MDKRKRDLDSIKRLAEWDTKVENEGHGGREMGPVIELELGYRGASYFLHSVTA